MSEPLFDAAREASGVDPDKIAFDGIVEKSTPKLEEEGYPQDMEATLEAAPKSLTAQDRCDRCGAQAYLQVELPSGLELLFCAHHSKQHIDKLTEVASIVIDDTAKLSE